MSFLLKLKNKKYFRTSAVLVCFLVVFGILGVAFPAHAFIEGILARIARSAVYFLGSILLFVIDLLIRVSSYNNFIKSNAVKTGWPIVRDVCNMFFIVVLLIIAFSTILKIESYHAKKLLAKLLIMAVLVNFSKLICGLLIDFAQVVMMTFVTAYRTAAAGNFVNALGIGKMLNYYAETGSTTGTSIEGILMGFFLALVMTAISLIVIAIMLLILVFRIVILWMLVILSPIAFLAQTFPAAQKYANQWWQMFGQYVIIGPVLAFFLWLSLSIAGGKKSETVANEVVSQKTSKGTIAGGLNLFETEAGRYDELTRYVVAIAMLVAGLMFAQQSGVAGGAMAGRAISGMQRAGTAGLKRGLQGAARISGVPARIKGTQQRVSDTLSRGRFRMLTKEGREARLGELETRARMKGAPREVVESTIRGQRQLKQRESLEKRGLITPHTTTEQLDRLAGLAGERGDTDTQVIALQELAKKKELTSQTLRESGSGLIKREGGREPKLRDYYEGITSDLWRKVQEYEPEAIRSETASDIRNVQRRGAGAGFKDISKQIGRISYKIREGDIGAAEYLLSFNEKEISKLGHEQRSQVEESLGIIRDNPAFTTSHPELQTQSAEKLERIRPPAPPPKFSVENQEAIHKNVDAQKFIKMAKEVDQKDLLGAKDQLPAIFSGLEGSIDQAMKDKGKSEDQRIKARAPILKLKKIFSKLTEAADEKKGDVGEFAKLSDEFNKEYNEIIPELETKIPEVKEKVKKREEEERVEKVKIEEEVKIKGLIEKISGLEKKGFKRGDAEQREMTRSRSELEGLIGKDKLEKMDDLRKTISELKSEKGEGYKELKWKHGETGVKDTLKRAEGELEDIIKGRK